MGRGEPITPIWVSAGGAGGAGCGGFSARAERAAERSTSSRSRGPRVRRETTLTARRTFEGPAPVWHYNRRVEEGPRGRYNERRAYGEAAYNTWTADAAYPDVMLLGDPHINYYEGSARYDDLELWVPERHPG